MNDGKAEVPVSLLSSLMLVFSLLLLSYLFIVCRIHISIVFHLPCLPEFEHSDSKRGHQLLKYTIAQIHNICAYRFHISLGRQTERMLSFGVLLP